MNIADVKPGMRLKADDGFTCIKRNAVLTVELDENGLPFVPCRRGGHWLAGQVGKSGELIGFELES